VRPGEITLAHKGVLFLDELAEFCGPTLQALRQPLEEHVVRVTRAEGSYEFPADFALVAASNPCPCGHLGDTGRECRCSETAVRAYRAKLGGPVLDRIAMMVTLERPDLGQVMAGRPGAGTSELRGLVERGRAFAAWRGREDGRGPSRVQGVGAALARANVDGPARLLLEEMARRGALSVRAVAAVVAVARTVADIDEREQVGEGDVLEAVGYRVGR
jgi:magnesium chelatase family protein